VTACAAGCGVPLRPPAAAGGFDRHPGCEQQPETTEYRWGCLGCLMTGVADSAPHAAALERSHRGYACPATADSEAEFLLRLGRRAPLERLYPDQVPPYRKPFRPTA